MSLALMVGCGGPDDPPAVQQNVEPSAATGTEQAAGSEDAWVVSFHSYGPIPLGVEFEEAVTASAGVIQKLEHLEGCTTTAVTGGPEDVSLMVVDGRIVRVDVWNTGVKTREGAAVGDSEERVQRLYPGTVEIQPHKYTDGHYLVVAPSDGSERRLIFETDGGVVRTYRAGVLPEVSWVEGCG